ncbi:MAG TPA: hypothetical protein VL989_03855 [Candidatus Sulfotelmatobacter sp.]|nr:hypothetical protein [Candidatus Sulfotelmatobacter sp.]
MTLTEIWNKTWRDKHGKVVIWQNPNPFLIAWLVLTIISLLINGTAADICQDIGVVSIAIWSFLELFQGVNYFRRVLGLVVLLSTIATIINIA